MKVAFLASFVQHASAAAASGGSGTCGGMKKAYDDSGCSGHGTDELEATKHMQIRPLPVKKLALSANPCSGKKPDAAGFNNQNCSLVGAGLFEQSGTNVTAGYAGTFNSTRTPITDEYRTKGLCPVNVHWHWGAEHLSVGQYDSLIEDLGPAPHTSDTAGMRRGFRCSSYASLTDAQKTPYKWKHCTNMKVGDTYEVHWPHSAVGKCHTPHQYQTPFYDGVVCGLGDANAPANTEVGALAGTQDLVNAVGVQGQVFLVVNDEDYYYPDMIAGAVVDGNMWADVAKYTGSTTGTSRNNELCSAYAAITWQVDRKCHMISASSFDKMCADMLAMPDDMSGDVHPHGARELVSDHLAANNHKRLRELDSHRARENKKSGQESRVLADDSSDICTEPTTTTTAAPASNDDATTTAGAAAATATEVKFTMSASFNVPAAATEQSLLADTTFVTGVKKAIAANLADVAASDVEVVSITFTGRRLAERALASTQQAMDIETKIAAKDDAVAQTVTTFASSPNLSSLKTSLETELASSSYTVAEVSGVQAQQQADSSSSAVSSFRSYSSLLLAALFSGFDTKLAAVSFMVMMIPQASAAAAEGEGAPKMKCADVKNMFKTAKCCENEKTNEKSGFQLVPKRTIKSGTNTCAGKKPSTGFSNKDCLVNSIVDAVEQSGSNVTVGYVGGINSTVTPRMTTYFAGSMCPVNVHWHWGAEHLSVGEYDSMATSKGPSPHTTDTAADIGGMRRGFRCNHYDASDAKFDNSKYMWQHCQGMKVGETYEVHWPHSALGACGTPNQYQTPFYDGVLCNMADPVADNLAAVDAATLASVVGVQAQVFTIVNDEDYYYPNLFRGALVDATAAGEYWKYITYYTGSTTGTTRNNQQCSKYAPITWQVDRKCHLISASSFDKMCADMKAIPRDDMSGDLYAHGARELVADNLAAMNHQFKP